MKEMFGECKKTNLMGAEAVEGPAVGRKAGKRGSPYTGLGPLEGREPTGPGLSTAFNKTSTVLWGRQPLNRLAQPTPGSSKHVTDGGLPVPPYHFRDVALASQREEST